MAMNVVTADGFYHRLPSLEDAAIAAYSTSENTRQALRDAIALGHVEELPLPPPPGPIYDPKTFRVTFLSDPLFQEWQLGLPAIGREDLKMAAIADAWPTCQALYSQLSTSYPTPQGAVDQWQAIADAHAVPLSF